MHSYIKRISIYLVILLICFLIIMFKFFYPYHRMLVVTLHILSYLIFINPLLKKVKEYKLRYWHKITFLKKYWIHIVVVFSFILIIFLLIILFPIYNLELSDNDVVILNKKTSEDLETLEHILILLKLK